MPVTRDMLLSELRDLLRLTAFEQAIATVRRTQAASTPIADELAANARKAGERLALLSGSVRQLGGVPDLVGPLVGRAGALLQTQLNQVQTLQGALLGDLALEHSLRERARYARTLAVTLGESSVIPVLDRLDAAHTETIEWLETRLAEVGATGTSALRATPVQALVGQVRRVYGAPFAVVASGVNRLGGLLTRGAQAAPDVLSQAVDTVEQAAATTKDTVQDQVVDLTDRAAAATGRAARTAGSAAEQAAGTVAQGTQDAANTLTDTAQDAAEAVTGTAERAAQTVTDTAQDAAGTVGEAARTAADTTAQTAGTAATAAERAAQTTHEVLEQTGGDDLGQDVKHPFAGYEKLTGDSIMRHVDDTEDVEELRTLLAFEQAHKARKGVLSAAQARLTALSASV